MFAALAAEAQAVSIPPFPGKWRVVLAACRIEDIHRLPTGLGETVTGRQRLVLSGIVIGGKLWNPDPGH